MNTLPASFVEADARIAEQARFDAAEKRLEELASPNTSRYIRALMRALLHGGEARVQVTDTVTESKARTRIYNAASRARVHVTTRRVEVEGTTFIIGTPEVTL